MINYLLDFQIKHLLISVNEFVFLLKFEQNVSYKLRQRFQIPFLDSE